MSEIEFAEIFAAALVSEIKAEMGRQSLSSRGLGRLIGKSSQYMSDRLDGGNVKTGRRVVLNVWDISAIAKALGLTEVELITRAENVARRRDDYDLVANDSIDEFPAGDDTDYDHA
jgi:hypothetical protein